MAEKKQPILRQSDPNEIRLSFRSYDMCAEDSSHSFNVKVDMSQRAKALNIKMNSLNKNLTLKQQRSVRNDLDHNNNKSSNHESLNEGKGFIKMAKSSNLNLGNSFSRTGFTNKEILSPENFSQKSSFIGSSLLKYVNFLQSQVDKMKPKNLYGKFNSMINPSHNLFNDSDKKATNTNRSMTNRYYNKPKLSERPFSESKLNISNSNRQVDLRALSGERLYRKGIATLERSKKKLNLIKSQKYKKEMRECSFRPKLLHSPIYLNMNIIKRNNLLTSKSNRKLNNSDNENIHNYSNNFKKNRKTSKFKSANYNKEIDSMSYNIISRTTRLKSAEISRVKKSEEDLIKLGRRLFNDAEKLRVYKEKLVKEYYNENYPFQPKLINSNSKPDIYNFFHRLQGWVDKRNEKYLNDIEKTKYDEKTGLRLFSPNIIRDRLCNEDLALNENSKNKFMQLYEEWRDREERENARKDLREQEFHSLSKLSHMNINSKEILNEMIHKIFHQIFESIADPSTRLINCTCVDSVNLPNKIKEILQPLTSELKELRETLDSKEFIDACKQLYQLLTLENKRFLIEWYFSNSGWNKKKRAKSLEIPICSFRPIINTNSKKIFERTIGNEYDDLVERVYDFARNKEKKLNLELEKKKVDETLKCTFKPVLVSKQMENKEVSKFYDAVYEKYKQRILNNNKKA